MVVFALFLLSIAAVFPQESDKAWADRILKNLSLPEKIGQLVQVRVPGRFLNRQGPEFKAIRDLIQKNRVGGVVLFAGNVYESAILLNELQRISKLPLLVSSDFERGAAFRIEDTTSFPWTMAVGASGSEEYAFQQGLVTAQESRALGVHWIFAPVLDVNNNPENPVINIRSYGEDPQLVARLGSAFIRGARKGGVLTTAKHFPGHGDTATDSHLGLAVVHSDMDRLQSVEFAPFRSAIVAGVDSVMTAHVAVPEVTGDNEAPATLSPEILTSLLRDNLKFNGLIVTDALEMGGITNRYWCGVAAVRAIQAGADVLLLPPDAMVAINEVERAVKRGDIPASRVDDSVRRILLIKSRLGLRQRRLVSINRISETVSSPQNMKLAQDIADHSITVIKDEQHLLPLNPAGDPKLLSLVLDSGLESSPAPVFQAEMRQRFPSIRTAWANARVSDEVLEEIERDISRSDVIVCSTLVRLASGQDASQIPRSHRAIFRKLLASNKPLIWISFGNPYVLPLAPNVGTYICAFSYSGVSQAAAAKALTGEIAVTGKMPVSIPGYARAGDGIQIPKLEMILKDAVPGAPDPPANAFEKTTQLLTSLVDDQVFQRAEILVGYKGAIALKYAAGVTRDAVYDLASLSTIAVASGAMLAADSGRLIPDAPVQDYVPEFKGEVSKSSVQDLLALLASRPEAETAEDKSRQGLLTEIISRVSAFPFQRFLDTRLFEPLGMKCTLAPPPESVRGNAGSSATAGSMVLFCSAHDLAVLAQMLLNRGIYDHRRYLKADTISKFTGRQGPWSKPSNTDWTGRWLSSSAFGYSSANGSSLWIDPARQLFLVFLTSAPLSAVRDGRITEAQEKIFSSAMAELTVHD
jgi:beta-glucosidase-like glycosyl hydrolase/CubicO group peptidase (beta-lactamase class C family)